MNINIKSLLVMFSSLFIYSCASQGYPSGGPRDMTSPELIEINPKSNTIEIGVNQNIILTFDEMIEPTSLYEAIRINPETVFKIIYLGNKIKIIPNDSWTDGMFKLIIKKSLSDYNGNTLLEPIEILYSTNSIIIQDSIVGQLFNIKENINYSIAVLNKDLSLISKGETDIYGKFIIKGLNASEKYVIVGIEGEISDNILNDIENNRYGISNSYVKKHHNIYMSDPLWRLNINSVNFINDNFGVITLNNNSKKYFLINNDELKKYAINSDDFIYMDYNESTSYEIKINLNNLLENYEARYTLNKQDLLSDTISPFVVHSGIENSKFIIDYSEPVLINKGIFPFYSGDNSNILSYRYISPKMIEIDINGITALTMDCSSIADLNQNILCDSTITILCNGAINNVMETNKKVGSLDISVNRIENIHNNLILELINANDKADIKRYKIKDDNLLINNLLSGEYIVWIYEDKNIINDNYFSGILNPLLLSADFMIYDKVITIRPNWTNSISVDF